MTQQEDIFVGWLTPQNLFESVPWRKGDREHPLFYWVFLWGHQIQWFLFYQGCNQGNEDHRLNVRFKTGGFVPMPKTGIAAWPTGTLTPGDTKTLNATLKHLTWDLFLHTPRPPPGWVESYLPHTCHTAQHLTSFCQRQPHTDTASPSQMQLHLLFERGTAEGSSDRELQCNTVISMKSSIWPMCIREYKVHTDRKKKRKKIMK